MRKPFHDITPTPVFVCIWAIFLSKNIRMSQNSYFEVILDEHEFCIDQCPAEVFMQDRAPGHSAILVINWFEFCNVKLLTPWPGNSLNLNPIQNLWALIKHQLQDQDTSSLLCLQNATQDIWDSINQEYVQNPADSLPEYLHRVRRAEGTVCTLNFDKQPLSMICTTLIIHNWVLVQFPTPINFLNTRM